MKLAKAILVVLVEESYVLLKSLLISHALHLSFSVWHINCI